MSRSHNNRSGKGEGFTYGARRHGNFGLTGPGKYGGKTIKQRTNRAERRAKKHIAEE